MFGLYRVWQAIDNIVRAANNVASALDESAAAIRRRPAASDGEGDEDALEQPAPAALMQATPNGHGRKVGKGRQS